MTVSSAEASRLLADGYVEVSSLGWGLTDQGRLRKGKAVVRYRRTADGVTVHTSHPRAEIGLDAYDTEGERFQLLPEPNGWAVPLYRLRAASGAEVLSSSTSEVPNLVTAGYMLDGVVGWIYRDQRGISTLNPLVRLVRLEKDGEYEHSVDPTEIAALKALGYGSATVLGRVIRSPAGDLDPTACIGRPDPLDRIEDLLGPTPPAGQTEITSLLTFVSAYTMHRVLTGQIESPTEMQMAELLRRPRCGNSRATAARRVGDLEHERRRTSGAARHVGVDGPHRWHRPSGLQRRRLCRESSGARRRSRALQSRNRWRR